MLPPSVNFHINQACNYRCEHCFATFLDVKEELGKGMLAKATQLAIVQALDEAGFDKITFAGGEPTLVPWLPELIEAFTGTTMLVTNGSMLDEAYLDRLAGSLDWVVLSVDASTASLSGEIGRRDSRGQAMSGEEYVALANAIKAHKMRLKVNTVVSTRNHDHDMADMIAAMAPERWKILQVLPVEGQNDEHIAALTIERAQFDAFIARHEEALSTTPVTLVPEPCDTLRGSYAMVDPAGRFFDSALGFHTYSRPILDVGVNVAFSQVSFDEERFDARGGRYDWK